MSVRPVSVVLLALGVLLLAACHPAGDDEGRMRASDLLGGEPDAGFARAREPRPFRFPADHGPHPDYQTEWWYLTGNLSDTEGGRYGFQVTFFRFALAPEVADDAPWRTRDVWMAHVALTDTRNARHHAAERFARGAAGLAGARAAPLAVWLDDWRFTADPDHPGRWRLALDAGDFALSLALTPKKPVVLQGEHGLSQKSAEPGNASYYYSLTRIAATGELRIGDRPAVVDGLAWLDREWSTSALAADQAGWDWFALQLDDGRELMYYRLRLADGGTDPASAGSLVAPDGRYRTLSAGAVRLEPLRHWQTWDGRRYPVEWRLHLQPGDETWRIRPVLDDQEMDLSVRYWEGAVDVLDAAGREIGRGYVELAGYD
ncbi:MAG TPA: carotenoid 1,2-hydratase [Thioalkalivibrio sp.]|nr:carotenoid 1,2-hydratase [Thioalkalivibrio sp.]